MDQNEGRERIFVRMLGLGCPCCCAGGSYGRVGVCFWALGVLVVIEMGVEEEEEEEDCLASLLHLTTYSYHDSSYISSSSTTQSYQKKDRDGDIVTRYHPYTPHLTN
ncbi:hypothetical protein BPAE_0272g00040 [Botrytis paeoniae]|uniref:Uncharacterized protein n=1 Tax=Botrytis paeoniae TaxID=278948 RepID=A0A4Z1FD63_9HELO|nr:hypothetical protein BPAE_0272g00040 [Botrytis paeoniae]